MKLSLGKCKCERQSSSRLFKKKKYLSPALLSALSLLSIRVASFSQSSILGARLSQDCLLICPALSLPCSGCCRRRCPVAVNFWCCYFILDILWPKAFVIRRGVCLNFACRSLLLIKKHLVEVFIPRTRIAINMAIMRPARTTQDHSGPARTISYKQFD